MKPSKIRNILQSVQTRDVIKQAPDLVVYIEGLDYLINPYLAEEPGLIVAFNNYVSSFQSNYDLEQMIPSCTISLAVPNVLDHLFRTPGGNNILKTMQELRVYTKGYYLSPRGNSLYHQVFRGFVTSIMYTMDGKFTNIAINGSGDMAMLERMQIDVSPALMSAAQGEATPMASNTYNMDPYKQIAYLFTYTSMLDGFSFFSLTQGNSKGNIFKSDYLQAVEANFVVKWQAYLFDLCRDVHVFGVPNVMDVTADVKTTVSKSPASKEGQSEPNQAARFALKGNVSEQQSQEDNLSFGFYDTIRQFMPDMSFGALELYNGKIMTRLERLRHFTSLVGYEAYQDIDGAIIIKPPLYNLDVTVVSDPAAKSIPPTSTLLDLYDQNNPFVVQLSEILEESESEDEAQVKMTRVLARGSMEPGIQFISQEQWLTPAEDMDIPKMAQFGLRTAPPIEVGWFKDHDRASVFAYASTELARMNRGFRTYSLTIPLRPELKLGFPMYLPHKDIYGYIRSVSINFTRGSNATMSITLDSLRRRPMLPEVQKIPDKKGFAQPDQILLTPQLNLVLEWTKPEQPVNPDTNKALAAATMNPAKTAKADAALVGKPLTTPLPLYSVHDQDWQMQHYRQTKIGNSYMLQTDTDHCWRVQLDRLKVWDHPRRIEPPAKGDVYAPGNDYYKDLQQFRPYTDYKGYEVIGTFPYGRWDTLKNCVNLFTIQGIIKPKQPYSPSTGKPFTPVSAATESLSNAQAAFLFAGIQAPSGTAQAADQLQTALYAQSSTIRDFKVFELSYDQTNTPSQVGGQPSTSTIAQTTQSKQSLAQQYAAVMLAPLGSPAQINQAQQILDNMPKSLDTTEPITTPAADAVNTNEYDADPGTSL